MRAGLSFLHVHDRYDPVEQDCFIFVIRAVITPMLDWCFVIKRIGLDNHKPTTLTAFHGLSSSNKPAIAVAIISNAIPTAIAKNIGIAITLNVLFSTAFPLPITC